MPTAVGPNTYGEENLVFGYDLGDVSNSYKGEPTTNVIAGTNLVNVVAGTFTTNTTVGGVRILENTQVNNSHVMWNGATGFIVTCSAGAYITVSAEYKTTCTIRMRFRDNPYDSQYDIDGGNIATISQVDVDIPNTQGEWVRYSATAQTSTANPDLWWYLVDYRNNNQFGRVEIRNWQIEVKSHPTPYVNVTRSATQGLIDLKGNSTIDLSNVSFDSNAQMTFDGTNDYVEIGGYFNYSNATLSMWIHPYSISNITIPVSKNTLSSPHLYGYIQYYNGQLRFYAPGNNLTVNWGSLSTNTWYHIVLTVDGAWHVAYKNGVQISSQASSLGLFTGEYNVQLGRYGNGSPYIYNGLINSFQIYNRALTASEVKANFNAVKSRFGI